MKKITIIIFLSFLIFPINLKANTFSLSATCSGGELTINRHNLTTGASEVVNQGHTCAGLDTPHMVDPVNGLFIIEQSGSNDTLAYDYTNNTITNLNGSTGVPRYVIPYTNTAITDIITTGTDAKDGSTTTILGSLDISDSNGNTLIENKADGSVHIGENSLVTQEVNGVQQLYATNSVGNQIDLNIKSGTNLLIGGRNIMDIIGGDISGSVALSSALAALPNFSPDAFYTCGLGTGIHDSSLALSAGCASDFSNYAFAKNLPKIFQTASFNIGSSFLMNGEPDISEVRDMSIKAGITFKFGSVKPSRVVDRNNYMLENKIDAVIQENRILKAQLKEENDLIRQENHLLKAQIAEINTQLKSIDMLAMN